MKKIVKKDKPFKPTLWLQDSEDGAMFLKALAWANIHYHHEDKVLCKAIKDFAYQFAKSHTKIILWGGYPFRLPLHAYEALLIYKIILQYHNQMNILLFPHFVWEIDQKLAV